MLPLLIEFMLYFDSLSCTSVLLRYLMQYCQAFRRLQGPETLRQMLKQINNYIFPDETPFDRPLPPLVMKSHEIKFLECASGLGSTGTNR